MAKAKSLTGVIVCREDFMRHVDQSGDCWLWTGVRNRPGYGYYRGLRAHRVSYWLHQQVDPGVLEVCHHCDNPPCVNPNHLFLGDAKANAEDRHRKGRSTKMVCEDHTSAKLNNAQVMEIRRQLAEGRLLQREIAAIYGIDQSQVSNIKLNKYWRALDAAA